MSVIHNIVIRLVRGLIRSPNIRNVENRKELINAIFTEILMHSVPPIRVE